MKVNDFYNEVARHADTPTLKINAADTKRVLHVAFKILAKMKAADCADTIAKALALGAKK
jgi:hypothetical protein